MIDAVLKSSWANAQQFWINRIPKRNTGFVHTFAPTKEVGLWISKIVNVSYYHFLSGNTFQILLFTSTLNRVDFITTMSLTHIHQCLQSQAIEFQLCRYRCPLSMWNVWNEGCFGQPFFRDGWPLNVTKFITTKLTGKRRNYMNPWHFIYYFAEIYSSLALKIEQIRKQLKVKLKESDYWF